MQLSRCILLEVAQSTVPLRQCLVSGAEQALATLFAFADQEISYTDAIGFAVMRRLGIAYVFSFHDDFVVAGFANIRHVL